MTALQEYEHLECPGIWRPETEAQRRDVSVSIGDATLVISDQNGKALAHWSLPAVQRVNPGEMPAFFSPAEDATELLEIEEELMIEAIEKVRRVIRRRRPQRGRLRALAFVSTIAAIGAFAVFVLPDVVLRHTLSVVPEVKRDEIGQQLYDRITDLTGGACTAPGTLPTLARLQKRLEPAQVGQILIMRGPMTPALHLPGRKVLLDRSLVEDFEGPEVLAGYILAETQRADARDPLQRLLEHGGVFVTLRLLTTGTISDEVLRAQARTLLRELPEPVSTPVLLDAFQASGVPSSPYAYALDPSGEETLGLIEADPVPLAVSKPLLSDADWVGLQAICGG